MRKQSKLQRCFQLALLCCAWAIFAGPAMAIPLSDLLAGDDIIIGDKRFYDFSGYASSGTGIDGVDPATINVLEHPNPPNGEVGLFFQRPMFVENGQILDVHFEFFVEFVNPQPGMLLSDNTLEFTASQSGNGVAIIGENVLSVADDPIVLAIKQVVVSSGNNVLLDHQDFTENVPRIHVVKDIGLISGQGGTAFISDFSQTFSMTNPIIVVPEPTSLLLLLGCVGMFAARPRRMRRR